MKEFVLLFRQPVFDISTISPSEMQAIQQKWMNWTNTFKDHETVGGQRLAMEGKVLKAGGVITDGPFVEIRERLGGFVIVKAENMDEATTIAHGCPVLELGGSVEIRPIFG